MSSTTPGALQAWHIAGATGSFDAGTAVLLLSLAVAGLLGSDVPRWLGAVALALVIMQFTPGLLAWLLFHAFVVLAGITLAIRKPALPV